MVSTKEKMFIFLIGKIPNWEVYLTDKQLECVKAYISCLDASMVDDKLNLTRGTAYKRIYGSSSSKGAYGKLEEVYNKLNNMGFFTEKEKKKQTQKITKPLISDKTLLKVKELFTLIKEIENYDIYLTPSQNEKLYQFLKYRNFKECAKYFGISEGSIKQSILGRTDDDGILGKLRKVYNESRVSSWDDI